MVGRQSHWLSANYDEIAHCRKKIHLVNLESGDWAEKERKNEVLIRSDKCGQFRQNELFEREKTNNFLK